MMFAVEATKSIEHRQYFFFPQHQPRQGKKHKINETLPKVLPNQKEIFVPRTNKTG